MKKKITLFALASFATTLQGMSGGSHIVPPATVQTRMVRAQTDSSLRRSQSEIQELFNRAPQAQRATQTLDDSVFNGVLGRPQRANDRELERVLQNIHPEEEQTREIIQEAIITPENWDVAVNHLLRMARGHIPFDRNLLTQAQEFIDSRGWTLWEDPQRIETMNTAADQYPSLGLFITDRRGNTLLGIAAKKEKHRTEEQKNRQRRVVSALNHLSESTQQTTVRDGLIHFLRHDNLEDAISSLKGHRKGIFHNKNANAGNLLHRATELGLMDVVLAIYQHLKSLDASKANFDDLIAYRGKSKNGGAFTIAERNLQITNRALESSNDQHEELQLQKAKYERILAILNAMQTGNQLLFKSENAPFIVDSDRSAEDHPIHTPSGRIVATLAESQDRAGLDQELNQVIQALTELPANFQEGVWENPGEELNWEAFAHEMQRFMDGQQGMTPEAAQWFLRMQKHFEGNRSSLPAHLQIFLVGPHAARMIFEWPLDEEGNSFMNHMIENYADRNYNDPLIDAYWAQCLGVRRMLECPDNNTRILGLRLINLIQKMSAAENAEERFEALVKFDQDAALSNEGGLGEVLEHALNWGRYASNPMDQNETADALVATIIWQGMHTPSLTPEQNHLKVQWTLKALQAAAQEDPEDVERLHALLPPGWENGDEALLNAKIDHDMPGHSSAQLIAKKLLKKLSKEKRDRVLNFNKAVEKVAPVMDVIVNSEVTRQAVQYFCPGFGYVVLPLQWLWQMWRGTPAEEAPKNHGFGGIKVVANK